MSFEVVRYSVIGVLGCVSASCHSAYTVVVEAAADKAQPLALCITAGQQWWHFVIDNHTRVSGDIASGSWWHLTYISLHAMVLRSFVDKYCSGVMVQPPHAI